MEFILSHLDSGYSSNDEELLEEIVANDHIVVQVAIVCANVWEYFKLAKQNEKNGQLVHPDVSVGDILVMD
jgi:hypothetical protein